MVRLLISGLLLILAACQAAQTGSSAASLEDAAEPPAALSPGDLVWSEVTNAPGEQIVLLAGDPARSGEYTLRRRFPPGHETPPHWHPHAEYGTVISGVFYIGFGEEPSRGAAIRVGPGGFIRVPPFTPHFSYADEEVVLQVHGPGPRQTYFVHETPLPSR
jgi:mannose-6-phosphate isomerase-like protein (cupin superfamily)